MKITNVSDIMEKNGKTWKENNLLKQHKFKIGSLVEVKYDKSLSNSGACIKVHARLFIFSHDRDCDGTPLYTLSEMPPKDHSNDGLYKMFKQVHPEYAKIFFYKPESGFGEESLTLVSLSNMKNELYWDGEKQYNFDKKGNQI